MSEKIEQPIQFANQGKHTPAIMHWTLYTPKERKKQAIKILLTMWGLALLCVPIIVAHFILVPGFFFAGIFLSYKKLTAGEKDAETADGDCPSCGKAISINLEHDGSLPQWRYCPDCSESIEFRPASETATEESTDNPLPNEA